MGFLNLVKLYALNKLNQIIFNCQISRLVPLLSSISGLPSPLTLEFLYIILNIHFTVQNIFKSILYDFYHPWQNSRMSQHATKYYSPWSSINETSFTLKLRLSFVKEFVLATPWGEHFQFELAEIKLEDRNDWKRSVFVWAEAIKP